MIKVREGNRQEGKEKVEQRNGVKKRRGEGLLKIVAHY